MADEAELIANTLLARMGLAPYGIGVQFGGDRDVYAAAGYPRDLTFSDYYERWQRQDVATRIIDLPVDDTWMRPPEMLDGADEKDAVPDSPFVKAWNEVAFGNVDPAATNGLYRRGIIYELPRVDRACGIGQYAVLLLGFRDGKDLDAPVRKGSMRGPAGLAYASALNEAQASIAQVDEDVKSERYGLPTFYDVTLDNGSTVPVHWTRTIHIADTSLGGVLYGRPRLQPAYNRLIDLEKVVPAAGEAGWRWLQPGVFLKTQEGHRLPSTASERTAVEEQASELVHGLRRVMLAQGLEPEVVSATLQDPSAVVDVFMRLISVATGIPKRILEGSERGELASSQDERAWSRLVDGRRANFAEPMILHPLIHRLVWAGVLPAPVTGRYSMRWSPVVEPSPAEVVTMAKDAAAALRAAGIYIEPVAFLREYFPSLLAYYVQEPDASTDGLGLPPDSAPQGEESSITTQDVTGNVMLFRAPTVPARPEPNIEIE